MNLVRRLLLIIPMSLVLLGCTKDWWTDKTGAERTALGTAYEILNNRGEFSLFLRAADVTDYKRLLNGGGLVSLFAPTDDVFEEYLVRKYGSTDFSAYSEEQMAELKLLVAYHIVQFKYSPEELLAFSLSSATENPEWGDGSVFKYQSYAHRPPEKIEDPITYRIVNVYHREKYLPVFSSRMFKSREIEDPQAEYEKLFDNVSWQGTDDQLYVQNAAVVESGILSDNGYLYVIDGVAEPLPTIYEKLNETGGVYKQKYSMFVEMLNRFNLFVYDKNITNDYAAPGDSLFYFYTYKKPSATAEIPEIGSEWAYHKEGTASLEKEMRYSITILAPNNDVMTDYIREFFSEFVENVAPANYVAALTQEAIYHILMAHTYDKRDLILPSELVRDGITGVWGEKFTFEEGDIDEDAIDFCSNGMIYGINKFLEPKPFKTVAGVVYRKKDYQWWGVALLSKDILASFIDENIDYTFLVQSDQALRENALKLDRRTLNPVSDGEHGAYCTANGGKIGDADMRKWILRNLYTMRVDVDLADEKQKVDAERVHYYQSAWWQIFMLVDNGVIYSGCEGIVNVSGANNSACNIQRIYYNTDNPDYSARDGYPGINGKVVEIDNVIKERGDLRQFLGHANMNNFREFLMLGGLVDGGGAWILDVNMATAFAVRGNPWNNATGGDNTHNKVVPQNNGGKYLTDKQEGYATQYSGVYLDTLKKYMGYYVLDMYSSGSRLPLLPGIHPVTGEYLYEDEYAAGWDEELCTYSPYTDPAKRFKMRVKWNPVSIYDEEVSMEVPIITGEPYNFTVYDRRRGYIKSNNSQIGVGAGNFWWATGNPGAFLRSTGAGYALDGSGNYAFDYRDIFVEEYPDFAGNDAVVQGRDLEPEPEEEL